APRVSVVIPCLNEAENIEECVRRAYDVLTKAGLSGEVIVVDNGSDDGSGEIARTCGATVIDEPRRGYGQAYRTGFDAAAGDYIVMIDADLTYDFEEIPRFVAELDAGAELVMGNRMDNIEPGAMSVLSRIGNPILTGFLNLVHGSPVKDAHCGLRAVRRDVLPALDLRSTGMEFASEMVIRAAKASLDVRELPIDLRRRGGESKLSPFRDGWRHLRLILVYSPTALFIVPGLAMVVVGAVLQLAVFAHVSLFGRTWYLHTLIAGAALVMMGAQVIGLGLCGRAYATFVMGERDAWFERVGRRFGLEHALLVALGVGIAGVALGAAVIVNWISHGFGSLGEEGLAVVAMTLVVTGIQIFFTSFLISLLGLRRQS
ncbi:MAG TPA: glycosyltransferase family 2 protein, partial [Gaiellaceae bacterium]